MGWRFTWVSSHGSRFNYDYRVSFTPEQVAAGEVDYNYGTSAYQATELHGVSVFAKNTAGEVFHTYSSYARGVETLINAFNFLDLAPKGRNETGTMSWVKLRTEYADAAAQSEAACCGSPAFGSPTA